MATPPQKKQKTSFETNCINSVSTGNRSVSAFGVQDLTDDQRQQQAQASSSNCYCCKWHAKCCNCLSNKGITWTKSLRIGPKVTPLTWSKWVDFGGKKNVAEKSYKFFRENYVHDICIGSLDENFVVKARCYRSLRKNEDPHYLISTLNTHQSTNQSVVVNAHCSCKGGSGGHCNHIFALLYQLNDFSSLGLKDIPIKSVSCTSELQKWHIPRATNVHPQPVMGTHFACSTTDLHGERKREPVRCKLFEARGSKAISQFTPGHIADHVTKLNTISNPPPFAYLLKDQEPTFVVNTLFGYMPVGSCLSYQLTDFERESVKYSVFNIPEPIQFNQTNVLDSPLFTFPDIPILKEKNVMFDPHADSNNIKISKTDEEFIQNRLVLTAEDCFGLEKMTILQSACPEWINQHKFRLTASQFGKVYFRVKPPTESFLKSIFNGCDLGSVKAVSHGRKNEKCALDHYVKYMQTERFGYQVFGSGLCVHPLYPYLGASPDGKIIDTCSKNPYGVLEIKCPYSKRDVSMGEALSDPMFYMEKVDNNIQLKPRSEYYCQIQGQMALTGITWCDFCVYLSGSREMCINRIHFDSSFWENELLPKLSHFYFYYAICYFKEHYK